MKDRIEQVILENLVKDEQYVRKVIPFLKDSYFMNFEDKKIFTISKAKTSTQLRTRHS